LSTVRKLSDAAQDTESRYEENHQMMRLMSFLLFAGLVLLGTGLYLLWFTPAATEWGIEGIALVVGFITLGIFLLIPAKIYIILRFTKRG
jgi:hypothetical protein